MPASYQATVFRPKGDPILNLTNSRGMSRDEQKTLLKHLQHFNDQHLSDPIDNTDKPIAGLLKDLKQRGLLDETLVIWGGEFGRQPTTEYAKGTGRDHNSMGFTMWMAGGGIKGGVSYGETDELGSKAVINPLHVKRMHATILHQMGLAPNSLSYFYNGLDQKLVGVEEVEPIYDIIA